LVAEIIDFERFRQNRAMGGLGPDDPDPLDRKGNFGMTQTIDPERLRQVRKMRGHTQEALAKKAGVNKQTVYRFEREKRPVRSKNLDRIANALDVEPGVLTGEKPIPPDIREPSGPADDARYQINVRVDADIRNAFSLAALRYKVPVRRIVEFAPLLFALAAEGNLNRRRVKLDELRARLKAAAESVPTHLLSDVLNLSENDPAVAAEERSIANRDLFAETIDSDACPDWYPDDEDEINPFVTELKELAAACDDLKVEAFGPNETDYEVCRGEALDLAGGDNELANKILDGSVLIHEIPRELLKPEAVAQRVDWIRQKVETLLDIEDII
jgi:transcriptional regulator with XRE-family HTH domain